MNHVMALAGTLLVIAFSYGLARLGEPQSVWLWRDLLGIIG